jgi:hypothetical protein
VRCNSGQRITSQASSSRIDTGVLSQKYAAFVRRCIPARCVALLCQNAGSGAHIVPLLERLQMDRQVLWADSQSMYHTESPTIR